MDAFVGEIRLFPFERIPNGWESCRGQVFPVARYPELFAAIGFTYGHDGSSGFALPDLRGRVAVGTGQGQGPDPYTLGLTFGRPTVTLTTPQMPTHSHTLSCGGAGVEDTLPSPMTFLSAAPRTGGPHGPPGATLYATQDQQSTSSVTMAPSEAGPAGMSLAHNNMSPFLTLSYCIALQGVVPKRP